MRVYASLNLCTYILALEAGAAAERVWMPLELLVVLCMYVFMYEYAYKDEDTWVCVRMGARVYMHGHTIEYAWVRIVGASILYACLWCIS